LRRPAVARSLAATALGGTHYLCSRHHMLLMLATICAGLFAGAATYVSVVEHPARLSCGTELALAEFAPSYRRGTAMQASLALAGCALAIAAWAHGHDGIVLSAGLLLGSVVPFTLIVILPTNTQLLDPQLDRRSARAAQLLTRWGRLHAGRSGLSLVAFVLLLTRFAGPASGGR
jgi:hypothetical protein